MAKTLLTHTGVKELEEKLEEYIPEVTVANVEGKVNGDGSIEPTIYIERRN